MNYFDISFVGIAVETKIENLKIAQSSIVDRCKCRSKPRKKYQGKKKK